jgi:hypothetical protein
VLPCSKPVPLMEVIITLVSLPFNESTRSYRLFLYHCQRSPESASWCVTIHIIHKATNINGSLAILVVRFTGWSNPLSTVTTSNFTPLAGLA